MDTWQAMQAFTQQRDEHTLDEIWVLEHHAVYTLGVAGKTEHILNLGQIPLVKTNRGGQITYHGPGQIVVYPLIDLHRRGISVRQYIQLLEQVCLNTLMHFGVSGASRKLNAPGVYVNREGRLDKIAALGVKVNKGRTFHGLALNVKMDLSPYEGINPCGYEGLKTIDMCTLGLDVSVPVVQEVLVDSLVQLLENPLV